MKEVDVKLMKQVTDGIVRPHAVILAMFVVIAGCATPPQTVERVEPPKIERPVPEPEVDTRVYRYEDRYFVSGAAIDKPTNIDDPMQALRVIQVKEGANQVLVISAFEKAGRDGASRNAETWFGIEMPSFAPGTYDVAKAVKLTYYRFTLDDNVRYDGKEYEGSITIEGEKDGAIIGSCDVRVRGITWSFEKPAAVFDLPFSGSFRIKQIPLEATRIGR